MERLDTGRENSTEEQKLLARGLNTRNRQANQIEIFIQDKERLVAFGYQQKQGVEYKETFAPVAKPTTFLLMLALTQLYNLWIHQLNVDSTFLNAPLDEEVFMNDRRIWKLNLVIA